MENIKEEVFLAYEAVRESGQTNMFDVNTVITLMEDEGVSTDKNEVLAIMKNYDALSAKYLK